MSKISSSPRLSSTRTLLNRVPIIFFLLLLTMAFGSSASAQTTAVVNLAPDYAAPGAGDVFSGYYGPPTHTAVSPGSTAVYLGRTAGIIKAGQGVEPLPADWDEGLFGFKPSEPTAITINSFASGPLTYDVATQFGVNPVWMTIEIDTGVPGERSDNTIYQHVPTTNPAGWHTVDAGAGLWQKWNDLNGDTTGNPLISLSAVATAHTGLNVVRTYLRLGMGSSYYNGGTGTTAWVDKTTIGGRTYDFLTPTTTPVTVLQPTFGTPGDGGGGVFSAYIGPPAYGFVSPGSTAVFDGRQAGIIKAGLATDPGSGNYEDEGLFAVIPNITINSLAGLPMTYDVENQFGANPVWITMEIDTGTLGDRSDNTAFQFVPATNPAGWHTVDAGAALWQQWTTPTSGIPTGPLMTLSDIAAVPANTGRNVVRTYLRLGMGNSYGPGPNGTQAWVDKYTIGTITYDFVTCTAVSIPNGQTVPTNTQFVVPITVTDTTGRNILAYDFTLTYDPAVVTPIAVETTGTLSTGWTITTNNSSGTLVVSGLNVSPLSGSGTLVNVRFISGGGITSTSSLNLTSFVFNEGVPCVVTTNGDVTVISGTVSGVVTYVNAAGPPSGPALPVRVPNTTISAAGSPSLMTTTDVNGFYSLSGFGAGAYTVTPSHANQVNPANGISTLDASRVAQHTVGFITLNATQLIAADVSGNGTVSSLDAAYIAQFTVGIPNPSVTGTWKFLPASRAYANVQTNQTNQDYSAILMGDVTGNWNPAGAARPSLTDNKDQKQQQLNLPDQVVAVTAPTQFAAAGSNFTVSVSTTNTSGEGILGYHFDMLYDENVIVPQAIPCDVTGTVSSGMLAFCNAATPGVLQVSLFGTMPTTGAGILLKLKFNAVGAIGNISPLTIQDFMFNEGVPLDVTTNGQVSLFAPTSVGAGVGGKVMTALGQPVSKARVTITDTNGESRTTLSSSLGYYRFYEVQVGQTYIITVESKRYTFIPLPVTVGQDLTNVDLIADQ